MNTPMAEPLIPLPDPFDFPPSLDGHRENDSPYESTFYEAFNGSHCRGPVPSAPGEATFCLDKTKTISLDTLLSNCQAPEASPLRKSLSTQDVRSSNVVMKYMFSSRYLNKSVRSSSSSELTLRKSPRRNSEVEDRSKRRGEAVALALKFLVSEDPISIDFDDWEYLMDEPSPNVSLGYLTMSDEEGMDEDSDFGLPKLKTSRIYLNDSVSDDAVTRYKAHRSSLQVRDDADRETNDESSAKGNSANNDTFEKADVHPEAPTIENIKIPLIRTSQDIRIKKNVCPATVKKGPVKALVPLEHISKNVAPPGCITSSATRLNGVLDKISDSSFSASLLASSTPVKDSGIPAPSSIRRRNVSFSHSARRSKSVSSPRNNLAILPSNRTQGPTKSALKRPSSAPSDVNERGALSTLPTNALKQGTPKLGLKNRGSLQRPHFSGKENLFAANRSRF